VRRFPAPQEADIQVETPRRGRTHRQSTMYTASRTKINQWDMLVFLCPRQAVQNFGDGADQGFDALAEALISIGGFPDFSLRLFG
jgi:hypothetical protein